MLDIVARAARRGLLCVGLDEDFFLWDLCSFYPTKVQEDLGGAILPPTLSLSSENLEHDGIYLLENGEDAMLYVNSQASREVLYQLFGVHSIDELQVGQVKGLTAQEARKVVCMS